MRFSRCLMHAYVACGLVVAFILLLSAPGLHAQTDTSFGAWKLNLAKSTYNPGPPPMSETRVYEPFGTGGVKATFNRVDGSGKKLTISYSALYDGKEYKFVGNPDSDTISLKRIDANTVESTQTFNGKGTLTSRAVVSPDGKVRTVTNTGTNPQGQKVNNVLVFDKQ